MNTWIKRTEREPQPDEFPVLAGYYLGGHDKWNEYRCTVSQQLGSATHWRSIKCDPPARELTQRERDMEMVHQLLKANDYPPHTWTALQAIYAERREVAKLLTEYFGGDCWRDENKVPDMRDIAARLDEQGAK